MQAPDIYSALDIQEDVALEAKKAAGRDGKGELPDSFFETYSAMANTYGGAVLLGVEERPKGTFSATGIIDTARVIKTLFDSLNNRQKVSCNLLTNDHVVVQDFEGKAVIVVTIPRAKGNSRPVYIGSNPLTGTYRRQHEGDYLCTEENVRRMLAEQAEPERDGKLLEGFKMEDINQESLRAYRQQFHSISPDHPWLTLVDQDFLRMLGGWAQDRSSGEEGLTAAGLLMWGKLHSIREVFPNYCLDYQERPEAKAEMRWVDRVTTDGTWSGNLFDFYRIVINRLTKDLKVPFRLEDGVRVNETAIHEALREALVNCLIHADYSGTTPTLVVKRPDLFGFRNPGLMRLPLDEAIRGGTSDGRNKRLQNMFQMAGLGERAGSGIPKIWRSWKQEHWRLPLLKEHLDPDRITLELRMVSLLPDGALADLQERFGTRLETLTATQKLALATVSVERFVTHSRLKSMCTDHSSDISKALSGLVKEGYLESAGVAKGTYYFFVGEQPEDMEDYEPSSVHNVDNSVHKGNSSEHKGPLKAEYGSMSAVYINQSPINRPSAVHVTAEDTSRNLAQLYKIAEPVRAKKRAQPSEINDCILAICQHGYIPLRQLAEVMNRSQETLRVHYLKALIDSGKLSYRYPSSPNHPSQEYKTSDPSKG